MNAMGSQRQTLSALIDKVCQSLPDKKALITPEICEVSYGNLQSAVLKCAARLRDSGIRPGDVIAISLPNTVEYVVAFLSVLRIRASAAPFNTAYTKEEFEFYFQDSKSKLLLVPQSGNPHAEAAAKHLNIPIASTDLVFEPQGTCSVTINALCPLELPETGTADTLAGIIPAEDDKALFLHTSGTTSRPKGVPLTQLNLATSAQNIKNAYEFTPSDCTVLVLPLFHVHGLMATLLSSLIAGATVVLPASGRFSASTFWSDMKKHGATWYTAVPTVHQILLERHYSKPEPEYPKLRFIRSCSAALAPAVLEKIEEAFGASVLEAYAMTEASHMMCTNPLPHRGPRKLGSVGKPVVEVAILNEDGAMQGPESKGEVCIRGLNVTKGYENNPEANKSAYKFGWFHTGDLGYLDEDGYLFLVGRIKELVNRGGEKISPLEVDAVLLSHPSLSQAVAFGVPDPKYGEEVNAAVVPKEGQTVSEVEVIEFCKKNLATFKVPKRVFVAETIPRTATGKVQRRAVAEHFVAMVSAAKMPKFGA